MVAVGRLANALRGEPSLPDLILRIAPSEVAALASVTLLGNAMRLLEQRMFSERQG